MNRLFRNSNPQDDKKLNSKIDSLFENKLFQKVVEKTDVLEDHDASASHSCVDGRNLLESGLLVENPSFLFKSALNQLDSKKELKGTENSNKSTVFGTKLSQKAMESLRDKLSRTNNASPRKSIKDGLSGAQGPLEKLVLPAQRNGRVGEHWADSERSQASHYSQPGNQQFKKKPKLDASNATFTDRHGLNSEMSQNEILNELTSKMQRDLRADISNVVDDELTESRNDEAEDSEDSLLFENEANQQGFSAVKVNNSKLEEIAAQINENNKFSRRTVDKRLKDAGPYEKPKGEEKENKNGSRVYLPPSVKFPAPIDPYYPKRIDNTVFDAFNLRIVIDRERTGFEESKDFAIVSDSIVGARYKIVEFLSAATFSKAVHAEDIVDGKHYCLKIIENNKDYLDQSIDEIKVLRYINSNCNNNPERHNIFHYRDSFYYKEHLFLVTELLKDNLYEYYKFNVEHEKERYFTPPRLKAVARQMLQALEFLHSISLIHCDIKPENITVKSYSRNEFRLIDFGSSCFIHDHLSSYVQSRFYRAPEVILGCNYDYKIDVWSLGCVLAELATAQVLFQSDSLSGVLARIIGTIGPIPEWMFKKGKAVHRYFTKEKLLIDSGKDDAEGSQADPLNGDQVTLLLPKRRSLERFVSSEDPLFIDFLKQLLRVDPNQRLSASEALKHSWLRS